jgi:hypothetical protein
MLRCKSPKNPIQTLASNFWWSMVVLHPWAFWVVKERETMEFSSQGWEMVAYVGMVDEGRFA